MIHYRPKSDLPDHYIFFSLSVCFRVVVRISFVDLIYQDILQWGYPSQALGGGYPPPPVVRAAGLTITVGGSRGSAGKALAIQGVATPPSAWVGVPLPCPEGWGYLNGEGGGSPLHVSRNSHGFPDGDGSGQ